MWISSQGNVTELTGNLVNEAMVLKSNLVKSPRDGRLVINRITWTKLPDGEVKQVWESSSDQEKTWQTNFIGIYKKKKNH